MSHALDAERFWSSKWDCQIYFIIGAQKAGTSSLHHYLAGHPQTFASKQKGVALFRWDKARTKTFHSYLKYFKESSDQEIVFEINTVLHDLPWSVTQDPRGSGGYQSDCHNSRSC